MASKLKTYTALILVLIGLMFLGIGCAGKNNESSSPSQNISSDGAPAKEATATVTSQSFADTGSQSISVKGSDTMLPLA
jgi:phosphate transport system substrate-binding protein